MMLRGTVVYRTHETVEGGLPLDDSGFNDLVVVGIGASAGGVQALTEFFENVPEGSDMAYVVILHLSPNYDSKLAEVLQSATKMPVTQVNEQTKVEPNHVYVVSPDKHLMMKQGYVAVSPNTQVEDRRAPVDIFFRTLAVSHGPRAVCVILSGTGANGSMGMKRVKEMGGAVFVQNPREALFNEMPRNSIATELVDEVLPVADIPAKIINYKRNADNINIPVALEKHPEEQQSALREVFRQLRVRTGHDFTNYKRPTLLRRIERRISVRDLPDLTTYATYVQDNPEETTALLKDLLISVTNFFRDKKAFEALAMEALPAIRNKPPESQLRIWVAGCATGEEAYSIAMLLAEQTMNMIDIPQVQIFATDIDEAAIATAREGYYTLNDAADVSAERLRRFFNKEGDGYRIKREIREMILFANHNFLKDPPFSRVDLVSCRNVLIYLNNIAQERVMETFHFALNPRGFLFLGSSESAGGASDLYTIVNRDYHIFRRHETARLSAYPVPDSLPSLRVEQVDKQPGPPSSSPSERISFGDLHQQLLEQYAPPSLVINADYDIVHTTERAGRYLQIGGGEPSPNLLKLIRPELRLELRSALYQAVQRQTAADARGLKVTIHDHTETVNIHVRPVLDPHAAGRGFILVLFQRVIEDDDSGVIITSNEPVAQQLEEELTRLKIQLRGSNEQHEFQAEELKASNEELQAMNEELRSAAEELETSKEELQSINEELRTVNQELKIQVEETTMASNNLHNLINSVDIGTISLDRGFRVAFFTPAARSMFNLIGSDIGRSLSDITNKLQYPSILEDAETVLDKLQAVEREVIATDNRIFMTRILPYRTAEDRINGVVITFFDITERKRLEEARYYLASIVESSEDSIITVNFNSVITSWNKSAEELYGFRAEEAIGQPISGITLPADIAQMLANVQQIRVSKAVQGYDTVRINKAGRQISLEVMLSPVKNANAELIGVSMIARDISARKQAEDALRESEEQFRTVANLVPDLLWSNDKHGDMNWYNQRWFDYTGQTMQAASGSGWLKAIHPDDYSAARENFNHAINIGVPFRHEHRIRRNDGSYHWFLVQAAPLHDTDGAVVRWFGAATDINEVRTAFESLLESRERMRITTENATDYAIMTLDTNGYYTSWSKGAQLTLGHTEEEAVGEYAGLIFTPEDREAGVPVKELEEAVIHGKGEDERWHLRKDGSRFFMSGVTRPIYNDGKLAGYVKVARDMTARKLMEQQKEEFIGIASHELKTPVTTIKAYAELLQDVLSKTTDTESAHMVGKLNAQVDRLIALIYALLDTTRVSEGRIPLNKELLDLNVLIKDRLDDLQLVSTRHRIRFESGDVRQITVDRERIGQVLINLVNNAVKYSPEGSEVVVQTADTEDGVRVSVRDHGIGIPADLKDKVFGRFFRANGPRIDSYPGLGLGLYIAEGIIHHHRGTISVDSTEGEGSVFYFTLPYDI